MCTRCSNRAEFSTGGLCLSCAALGRDELRSAFRRWLGASRVIIWPSGITYREVFEDNGTTSRYGGGMLR